MSAMSVVSKDALLENEQVADVAVGGTVVLVAVGGTVVGVDVDTRRVGVALGVRGVGVAVADRLVGVALGGVQGPPCVCVGVGVSW